MSQKKFVGTSKTTKRISHDNIMHGIYRIGHTFRGIQISRILWIWYYSWKLKMRNHSRIVGWPGAEMLSRKIECAKVNFTCHLRNLVPSKNMAYTVYTSMFCCLQATKCTNLIVLRLSVVGLQESKDADHCSWSLIAFIGSAPGVKMLQKNTTNPTCLDFGSFLTLHNSICNTTH